MAKESEENTPWEPSMLHGSAAERCGIEESSHCMVREQLARILRSSIFIQSTRLSRFLRFVVESTLSNGENCLKEYVIGTEVYDRKPPYHPSQDSIVRTEARRLRSKLKEYYESEGKADPMFIYFRTGSYMPVFRLTKVTDASSLPGQITEAKTSADDLSIAIAIVPYVDLSEDPLAKECARGITEELSHELMRTDGCRIATVSPPSLLFHESREISSLAQKLGVHLIFQGTVRKENRTLRISSRVLDDSGFQLWSQRFETESDQHHLFTITEQIASALVSRTRPQEARALGKNKDSSARMTLSAHSIMDEGSEVDVQVALSKFEEMVDAEPSSSRAHCGIAQCYCERALSGQSGAAEAVFRAKGAALQALALNSKMAAAHSCLGSVFALEMNWDAARKSFEQSLRLGPDAFTFRQLALFLTARQEFDEAWHYLCKAQRIDPFSSRQKLMFVNFLYFSRRYDALLEYCTGPLTYGPLPTEARLYLGLAYLQLGRGDDARELVQSASRTYTNSPHLMIRIAEVAARCGDTTLAAQIVAKPALRPSNCAISKFRQALLATAMGDNHGAMSLLATAFKKREPELLWAEVDPGFDSIRANNRFERIIRDLALTGG